VYRSDFIRRDRYSTSRCANFPPWECELATADAPILATSGERFVALPGDKGRGRGVTALSLFRQDARENRGRPDARMVEFPRTEIHGLIGFW
jgi:hypothetical protein